MNSIVLVYEIVRKIRLLLSQSLLRYQEIKLKLGQSSSVYGDPHCSSSCLASFYTFSPVYFKKNVLF